jgi:hypothetical protein
MPPVVRKRPWYLTVALLGALLVGSGAAREGWQTFVSYQATVDPAEIAPGIDDDADRQAVVTRFQTYLHVLDAAKPRAWPLAAEALVLGTAIFIFAMKVFGGNGAARAMLLQLLVVHAGVNAAGHWLQRDVLEAEADLDEALVIAKLPNEPGVRADAMRHTALLRPARPIGLAIPIVWSALIVVGLTRRRSNEFLQGGPEALGER